MKWSYKAQGNQPKSSSVVAADAIVTGDYLRSTNSNNILMSLQSQGARFTGCQWTILLGPPTGYGERKESKTPSRWFSLMVLL